MIDIAIRGAQIVDGSGKDRFIADVGIVDDKIAQIGNVAQAKIEIDGSGLTLSPGFIDPHSHSDFTFHTNPDNESSVHQGVTTEIVGNCGFSSAPLSDASISFTEKRLKNYAYTGEVTWRTFGEYLAEMERMKTSTNFAFLIGHNSLRLAAGIMGEEKVTDDQLKSMKRFIEDSMEAGALGMSSGLEFAPGAYSTSAELKDIITAVGKYDGIYASHVRNRDSEIFDAINEFVDIARAGGVRGQISHFNVRHDSNAPQNAWRRAVDIMENAQKEGLDITADTTPFREGIGAMYAILPRDLVNQGAKAIAEAAADPAMRKELRTQCDRYWRFIHKGQWHRVYLEGSPNFPELQGLSFPAISEILGKDEWDCYFDIMAAAGDQCLNLIMVGELFTDDHLKEMISHPDFSLGVDGYTSTDHGALSEVTSSQHPYCGHIEYLAHHVRELGTLTLETAIHKMTKKVAERFNIQKRGEIKEGYFADLVLFNADTVDSRSTIQKPQVYPDGITAVLVNGEIVVHNGVHKGKRPGQVIRRIA